MPPLFLAAPGCAGRDSVLPQKGRRGQAAGLPYAGDRTDSDHENGRFLCLTVSLGVFNLWSMNAVNSISPAVLPEAEPSLAGLIDMFMPENNINIMTKFVVFKIIK